MIIAKILLHSNRRLIPTVKKLNKWS